MTKEQLKNTVVWLGQTENQEALKLVIREVKYLLHHFRFRMLKGDITFGLDDPYTVGRILGLLSIFYPVYGEQFSVKPVFDRQVLEGDFSLRGKLRLIHIVVVLVRMYRNKTLRAQMKKMLAS